MLAAVYESVLLFAIVFFFGYAFSALTQFRGEPGPMSWAFQLFLFAVLGAYFTWFWSNGRRTLPMKTMWLLLLTSNGSPVSPLRAFGRYCACWAMLVAVIAAARELSGWLALLAPVPLLWTWVDRQRRALYDVVAGTQLVIVQPGDERAAVGPEPEPGAGRRR